MVLVLVDPVVVVVAVFSGSKFIVVVSVVVVLVVLALVAAVDIVAVVVFRSTENCRCDVYDPVLLYHPLSRAIVIRDTGRRCRLSGSLFVLLSNSSEVAAAATADIC